LAKTKLRVALDGQREVPATDGYGFMKTHQAVGVVVMCLPMAKKSRDEGILVIMVAREGSRNGSNKHGLVIPSGLLSCEHRVL
jgi:hypothetical protein